MVAGSESWELTVSYLAFLFPRVPKAANLSHPRYPAALRSPKRFLTLGTYLSYRLPQGHSHARYLPCPIVFYNVTLTLSTYLVLSSSTGSLSH